MRDWPSADEAAARFQAALEQLIEREPRPQDAALDSLMQRRRAATELAREALRRQVAALERTRAEIQGYRHEYELAKKSAEHHLAVADARLEELQSIRAERAYRAAAALRRVIRRRG
jgi:hypothetical protein